jgi:hypothetical protein
MVVCQKRKKWNCGGIHRITWKALWVFKFFIRYYIEFLFWSCLIDVPILSYGQIFRVSDFRGPAISYLPAIWCTSVSEWEISKIDAKEDGRFRAGTLLRGLKVWDAISVRRWFLFPGWTVPLSPFCSRLSCRHPLSLLSLRCANALLSVEFCLSQVVIEKSMTDVPSIPKQLQYGE